MKDRYSPEPINSFQDMRAIARQEALAVIQSPASIGSYAPKSVPWQAVDLPLVTEFPGSPQDRDEVNLYDEDTATVSRYVWSKKFNAWLIIGGGATGTIGVTALASPPVGAIVADGSAVTDDYPRLKALLVAASNPYGVSGSDPLRPDLVNNFIVGAGDTYALGASGGAATHTLTTTEMPSHTHSGPSHTHAPSSASFALTNFVAQVAAGTDFAAVNGQSSATASGGTGATGSAGSGGAHNNLPPYVAMTPFIWT